MRACYKNAIGWIVLEDDNCWLSEEGASPSVTACLVADIFGKSIEQVTRDLRREHKKLFEEDRSLKMAAIARRRIAAAPSE